MVHLNTKKCSSAAQQLRYIIANEKKYKFEGIIDCVGIITMAADISSLKLLILTTCFLHYFLVLLGILYDLHSSIHVTLHFPANSYIHTCDVLFSFFFILIFPYNIIQILVDLSIINRIT